MFEALLQEENLCQIMSPHVPTSLSQPWDFAPHDK